MSDAYRPTDGGVGVLVVDMTRQLADEDVDGAYDVVIEAVAPIQRLLDAARQAAVPVFFTRGGLRYYTSDATDRTPVERGGWPRYVGVRDVPPDEPRLAMEVLPAFDPDDGVVIDKTGPSAFFDTPLQTYLAALGVRTLVVCGATTSGCVRATVVDAFSRNYAVLLPEGAVADHRPEQHEFHLADMDGRYAERRDLEDVIRRLESVS